MRRLGNSLDQGDATGGTSGAGFAAAAGGFTSTSSKVCFSSAVRWSHFGFRSA